jgi:1-acyl-sn-glycerol-3-phosphate acyltransferase
MLVFFSIIRLIFFGIWSVFCILICFLFALLTFSKKPIEVFAYRLWAPTALFIMGARVKIHGGEQIRQDTPYVVMANHCSYLDIPCLYVAMPVTLHFVAKKELKKMPFLGWYLMLSGTILIDRKNTVSAKQSLAEAALKVKKGHHVAIFPEGTASKTGKMNAFKKGGFFLADDADATIVPIHVKGTYYVWPSADKLRIRRGKIEVVIGKPIPPEEYRKYEMDERVELVRSTIANL